MARISCYVGWDTYRQILTKCDRLDITPYGFFKRAILKALEKTVKTKDGKEWAYDNEHHKWVDVTSPNKGKHRKNKGYAKFPVIEIS